MQIDSVIERFYEQVQKHRIAQGQYARWLWQNDKGTRDLGINPYGCADAANILYTIGAFPSDQKERDAFVMAIQKMQDPKTGLFHEATHYPMHTTAHCIGALELFEQKPLYPLTELAQYTSKDGFHNLMESLDWKGDCWTDSHIPAGLYAALSLCGEADEDFKQMYFDWFWEEADEKTGLWRKGCIEGSSKPLYYAMAATFHYLFIHEYAAMPLRYPDKLIDTCLSLYNDRKMGADFGQNIGFLEVDWVYCLTRASRQTPYRFYEIKDALRTFSQDYLHYLHTLDWAHDDWANDLHALFGTVCCVAELQRALPGELRTKTPLKLVLDRRPFI